MIAQGNFEINMKPHEDQEAPVGRFTLDKVYTGDMEGKGLGQMISKRLENGVAVYFAIEEFSGQVKGKKGSFTLIHKGFLNEKSQSLDITILDSSGSDELASISGTLRITNVDGDHSYELDFSFQPDE